MPSYRVRRVPRGSIREWRGELWAVGASLGYALYQVFLRVAVREAELNNIVGATVQAMPTLLLAGAMGWFARRRTGESVSPLTEWKLLGALVVNGLLLFVVATPLLFAALREGGVLITTPLSGMQVIWAALLAALLLREPFTPPMAVGMLVSVAGTFLLTLGASRSFELSPTWGRAVPFALGAGLCWALAGVLLAYNMRRGVDGFEALAIGTLVGVVTINGYLLLTGAFRLYANTSTSALAGLIAAGTFSGLALLSLTTALRLTTVASATTLSSLQVAVAPLVAWLFLGESVNLAMMAGILLILAGVVVVQLERAKMESG